MNNKALGRAQQVQPSSLAISQSKRMTPSSMSQEQEGSSYGRKKQESLGETLKNENFVPHSFLENVSQGYCKGESGSSLNKSLNSKPSYQAANKILNNLIQSTKNKENTQSICLQQPALNGLNKPDQSYNALYHFLKQKHLNNNCDYEQVRREQESGANKRSESQLSKAGSRAYIDINDLKKEEAQLLLNNISKASNKMTVKDQLDSLQNEGLGSPPQKKLGNRKESSSSYKKSTGNFKNGQKERSSSQNAKQRGNSALQKQNIYKEFSVGKSPSTKQSKFNLFQGSNSSSKTNLNLDNQLNQSSLILFEKSYQTSKNQVQAPSQSSYLQHTNLLDQFDVAGLPQTTKCKLDRPQSSSNYHSNYQKFISSNSNNYQSFSMMQHNQSQNAAYGGHQKTSSMQKLNSSGAHQKSTSSIHNNRRGSGYQQTTALNKSVVGKGQQPQQQQQQHKGMKKNYSFLGNGGLNCTSSQNYLNAQMRNQQPSGGSLSTANSKQASNPQSKNYAQFYPIANQPSTSSKYSSLNQQQQQPKSQGKRKSSLGNNNNNNKSLSGTQKSQPPQGKAGKSNFQSTKVIAEEQLMSQTQQQQVMNTSGVAGNTMLSVSGFGKVTINSNGCFQFDDILKNLDKKMEKQTNPYKNRNNFSSTESSPDQKVQLDSSKSIERSLLFQNTSKMQQNMEMSKQDSRALLEKVSQSNEVKICAIMPSETCSQKVLYLGPLMNVSSQPSAACLMQNTSQMKTEARHLSPNNKQYYSTGSYQSQINEQNIQRQYQQLKELHQKQQRELKTRGDEITKLKALLDVEKAKRMEAQRKLQQVQDEHRKSKSSITRVESHSKSSIYQPLSQQVQAQKGDSAAYIKVKESSVKTLPVFILLAMQLRKIFKGKIGQQSQATVPVKDFSKMTSSLIVHMKEDYKKFQEKSIALNRKKPLGKESTFQHCKNKSTGTLIPKLDLSKIRRDIDIESHQQIGTGLEEDDDEEFNPQSFHPYDLANKEGDCGGSMEQAFIEYDGKLDDGSDTIELHELSQLDMNSKQVIFKEMNKSVDDLCLESIRDDIDAINQLNQLNNNGSKPLIPLLDFSKLRGNPPVIPPSQQKQAASKHNSSFTKGMSMSKQAKVVAPAAKKPGFKLNFDGMKKQQQEEIQSFHDEFMAKLDEYSESWRKAALKEQRH